MRKDEAYRDATEHGLMALAEERALRIRAERQRDEAREALRPFADRINEIEQVKAIAKFATEGTAAVKLELLRRARRVLSLGEEG